MLRSKISLGLEEGLHRAIDALLAQQVQRGIFNARFVQLLTSSASVALNWKARMERCLHLQNARQVHRRARRPAQNR